MKTITLTLKKIDALKWGMIAGALYALLSLIIIVPMFLFISLIGAAADFENAGLGILGTGVFMLFMPILYGVIGFIIGWIGAMLFNFIL